MQTEWIVQNADSITFVLHQGDITDHNNDEQWQNAVAALSVMDGKVPYTFVPGNHDLGPGGSASNRDAELLNNYLPYDRYSEMEYFGGAFETGRMENTYHTFRAGGPRLADSLLGVRHAIKYWSGPEKSLNRILDTKSSSILTTTCTPTIPA